ncbi:MAG: class I SAM-dependent methyltransferase [Nanoarchaeota archaeon]|nr:class I SAM-dependent methyltransferase [Nanoarchaeota archaeon]
MDQDWDTHWNKLNKEKKLFGKVLKLYREIIIANAVKYYFEKYFPKKGIFVEMGSGTSQTSLRIIKHKRKLWAVDISKTALMQAQKIPQIDKVIRDNILHTRFKENSIDGIWNLGVMEHFKEKDIIKILNEFHRVTKKGSYIVLFWPPVYGSTIMFFGVFEFFINLFKKEKFHVFPDEPTRLKSKGQLKTIIAKSKLTLVKNHFNFRDCFTHVVAVCKKE